VGAAVHKKQKKQKKTEAGSVFHLLDF